MAEWSKVSPLTVRCIPPLPGFESRLLHVRVASDLKLGGAFPRVLHSLQIAYYDIAAIWQKKVMKNEISNSTFVLEMLPIYHRGTTVHERNMS